MPLDKIVEAMLDRCICDDPRKCQGIGGDNMTSLVVLLRRGRSGPRFGSQKSMLSGRATSGRATSASESDSAGSSSPASNRRNRWSSPMGRKRADS